MWYGIFFAIAALGAASVLLRLQYKNPRGDHAHVIRGCLVALLAISALAAIEYALWRKIVVLTPHPVILGIHLSFALPTFIALVLIVASGIIMKRQLRYPRPEHEIYKPLKGEWLHRFLVQGWYFRFFWIATMVTGFWYFVIAVLG